MKTPFLLATVLSVLASSGLALPQDTTPRKQQAEPIPAVMPLVRTSAQCELTLPVTGLTADNMAKVKTALEGLKAEFYRCAECKSDFAKAGECPKCKKALTESKEVVLGAITPDATKGQLTVRTKPGMELRLSALERALKAESVHVDSSKLMLPCPATLVVAGATTQEQARGVEKALDDAKLFQSAQARSGAREVRVHVTGSMAPTLGGVRAALTEANPMLQVTDVIWNDWTPTFTG